MSRPLRVLPLIALTLVAGCFPAFYTDAPLGEPARWDASEWAGLWLFDLPENGKLVRLHVGVPGINGLTTTDIWRECDISQAGPWEDASLGKLRRHGEWYFEDSCEGRLATGEPCAYLGTLRRDKEVFTMHLADEVRIRRLLDEGKVPGRIELLPSDGSPKQRVVLNPRTDEHYKELLNPMTGAFPVSIVFGVRRSASSPTRTTTSTRSRRRWPSSMPRESSRCCTRAISSPPSRSRFSASCGRHSGACTATTTATGSCCASAPRALHVQPHLATLAGLRGVIVHEPDLVRALAHSGDFDFVVYGHTHVPQVRLEGNCLIVNPGKAARLNKGRATVALFDRHPRRPDPRLVGQVLTQ